MVEARGTRPQPLGIGRVVLLIVSVVSALLGIVVVVLALIGYEFRSVEGVLGHRIGQSLFIASVAFAAIGAGASRTRRGELGLPVALIGVAAVVGMLLGMYTIAAGPAVVYAGAFALAGVITVFSLAPPRFAKLWRAAAFAALSVFLLLLPGLSSLPTVGAGGTVGLWATALAAMLGLLHAISMFAEFVGLSFPAKDMATRTAAPTGTS